MNRTAFNLLFPFAQVHILDPCARNSIVSI